MAPAESGVAYPFVSLGFILTMLASAAMFGEKIAVTKVLRTVFVASGIIPITGG